MSGVFVDPNRFNQPMIKSPSGLYIEDFSAQPYMDPWGNMVGGPTTVKEIPKTATQEASEILERALLNIPDNELANKKTNTFSENLAKAVDMVAQNIVLILLGLIFIFGAFMLWQR